MKRTLLLSVLTATLFSGTLANAQVMGVKKITKALPKVDLGVKLGLNMHQLNGSSWQQSYNAGILGGIFIGAHKGKMGVQAEGLIKTVKFDFSNSSIPSSSVKVVYLDIPLMFQYNIIPRVWLQAGPQFSLMLSAKDKNSNDVKNDFKSSDISGVIGIDVKLPMKIRAGARYILGLTDINNSQIPGAAEAWRNRSIQIYVGYSFL